MKRVTPFAITIRMGSLFPVTSDMNLLLSYAEGSISYEIFKQLWRPKHGLAADRIQILALALNFKFNRIFLVGCKNRTESHFLSRNQKWT